MTTTASKIMTGVFAHEHSDACDKTRVVHTSRRKVSQGLLVLLKRCETFTLGMISRQR